MEIDEVKHRLESHLGHEVSDEFFAGCIDAFFRGHVGPPSIGSDAALGDFVPFERALGHQKGTPGHPDWPCREAIYLGTFFHQRCGWEDKIRECLWRFRNERSPLPKKLRLFIERAYGKGFSEEEDWGPSWYARMARRLMDSGMSVDGVIATMKEHRVSPLMVRQYGRSTGLRPENVADNILKRPPQF